MVHCFLEAHETRRNTGSFVRFCPEEQGIFTALGGRRIRLNRLVILCIDHSKPIPEYGSLQKTATLRFTLNQDPTANTIIPHRKPG